MTKSHFPAITERETAEDIVQLVSAKAVHAYLKVRKPLLESYAREWRAAHLPLPSGAVPLLEDARGSWPN